MDENFKKDNITVKEVKTYLSSRINGSIGVAKKAKDASAAMDFLSLLYGDEKYGNIPFCTVKKIRIISLKMALQKLVMEAVWMMTI